MSQEPTVPTRTGVMIAAAATALTLAAGVTVGSLLGWIGPDRAAPTQTPAEAPPSDPAPSGPVLGEDEVALAAAERPRREHRERGERHERKRRHHHHEERDHDD
jgi:hypothetical protein